MLHLFRKNGTRDDTPIDGGDGTIVVSHILTKFLKRLRHIEKPRLLDLGRLSGSNIEFFAQRGCRVQVEDLLLALESADRGDVPADAPAGSAPTARAAADDHESARGIPRATDALAADAVPVPGSPGGAPEASIPHGGDALRPPGVLTDAGALLRRPGARPSRRIVIPPRTFAARPGQTVPSPQHERALSRSGAPAAAGPAPLPTRFAYPDEAFDALVAWDIFNYYDPGALTLLASEARRILKPGGLLLGYFHARRAEGPETPRRYRILDEGRVACDGRPGPPMKRHVYQNRDIEKMFLGLSIVELYFLKNATRELLMEKKTPRPPAPRPPAPREAPKSRFTIE